MRGIASSILGECGRLRQRDLESSTGLSVKNDNKSDSSTSTNNKEHYSLIFRYVVVRKGQDTEHEAMSHCCVDSAIAFCDPVRLGGDISGKNQGRHSSRKKKPVHQRYTAAVIHLSHVAKSAAVIHLSHVAEFVPVKTATTKLFFLCT